MDDPSDTSAASGLPLPRHSQHRTSLPLAAWLLASATLPAVAAEAEFGRSDLQVDGNVASIVALSTPVDEILRKLGPEARLSVSGRCGSAGCAVVSGRRRGTVPEILRWLLGHQNHLIVHGDDPAAAAGHRGVHVVLLPSNLRGAPSGLERGTEPTPAAPSVTVEDWQALQSLRAARLPQRRKSQASPTRAGDSAHQQHGLPKIYRTSSDFGWRRDPFHGATRHHDGVDLVAPDGASLKSGAAGTVAFAGWAGGYGNMVEIDHGGDLRTRYAHLKRPLVTAGARVRPGQEIGLVGSTGRATGPHVHFEVRRRGEPQNPFAALAVWPELGLPRSR